jgi:DNA-binding MarR family transcriptional regulator
MNQTHNIDLEISAHADQHASLRLWLRMLSCTTLIEDRIRQKLREEFSTTLPRFDLLAQLEKNPQGLTMGELSKRMMISGGNVTAIVDQLETEGSVMRQIGLTDRRSYQVIMTPVGRQSFTQMAQIHEQWIVELFSDLSDQDQSGLNDLLGKLKASIYQNSNNEITETE